MHLILGVHCHQPLGNFDDVVEEAVDRAYLPFLQIMRRHPGIPFDVHYSGSLLEWLEEKRPDVLETLAAMDGQIEWMSGGCYEPVLPVIHPDDRLAQIERLSRRLEERFGHRPRGMWLTERVWDPGITPSLNRAGIEYLPLDDSHFLAAGQPPESLTGYFVTDHLGETVALFPISQRLRYSIPFEPPETTVEELRLLHARDPHALAVMADDGEKFGVWPGTHEWVYGESGWLERFLAALEAEGDWLHVTTFERFLSEHPPKGRVAVPAASYFEMGEWALPAEMAARFTSVAEELEERSLWERAKPFVRGGQWPNFQVKYPESNAMYRRMLRLSEEIRGTRGAPEQARVELLKGQANCAYWHGIFGGLYLSHLRSDVITHLIGGRRLLDAARHRSRRWTELSALDWDGDREEEVHVELAGQSWVLDPSEGGALHYFDDKPSGWPVSDVLARRFEAYHPMLQRARGEGGEHASIHDRPATGDQPPIERYVYDPHPRRWLVDHLLPPSVGPETFSEVEYRELADLPSSRHRLLAAEGGRGRATVRLEAAVGEGRLEKEVSARGRRLAVRYRLEGLPAGLFGPELPVSVWEGAGRVREGRSPWQPADEPLALEGRRFTLVHAGRSTRVVLRLDQPGTLFVAPIRTISKSESGYDEIFQGVVLWPHWETGGGSAELGLSTEIADG